MDRYTPEVEARLARMRAEYDELLESGRGWSLRELFSTAECDIDAYCAGFAPNRYGDEALAGAEEFCRRHGIWLEPGGSHYNSMTPYLHPNAVTAERMTLIGIYNAILFWLNDTVGREKFAALSPGQQAAAAETVRRLTRLLETGSPAADPEPVEAATHEYLERTAALADPAWMRGFRADTAGHLRPAIRDQNARTRGDVLSVAGYIELRSHVSGMYPAIALCEFGRDAYLDWARLEAAGLAAKLRTMRQLTVEIGALMNDVFSFEKECIADGADFNLVPLCLLEAPEGGLAGAVASAATVVRDLLTEFRQVSAEIEAAVAARPEVDPGGQVTAHVADLVGAVQATWVWQITTHRYKGRSIFEENRLG
ncbi:terpene synthase family protein [Nocardia harenae]|uniref:terpene synthase family protein n=1 Tax=Nocardia harenae TaxID=358707 RepID=UPI000A598EFF|nr:terpene synthase family protein [Nocardia harenae]